MNFHSRFCSLIAFISLFVLPLGAQTKDDTYILRANDTVRLSVYEEPDLSVQVKILQDGQASFPLIGSVKIGGTTVAASVAKIKELYSKDYLVDPKVTLTVDEYTTDFISVIGAVRQPGQIPIPTSGNIDLGAAIAGAGGLSPTADSDSIQLVRSGSNATSTYSLASIQGQAGRVKLGSGDRIIVNESRFTGKTVTVLGRVAKPGAVMMPVDGKLDLVTAVALAGGLTELANPKKVKISSKGQVRVVDFKELSERGGAQILLQPDDTVTVPERIF